VDSFFIILVLQIAPYGAFCFSIGDIATKPSNKKIDGK
jgi:hypothetical protein